MSNYKNLDANDYAEIFKALSNPNRLKILSQMITQCKPGMCCPTEDIGKCCVGDLGEHVDVAPSTLSHHLKELNRAGLIHMERRGQRMDCWVNQEIIDMLQGFFTEKNLRALTP